MTEGNRKEDSSRPTKESDLSDTTRSIHVVTTASLPWLTGTAVNPLLRALYFQRSRTHAAQVTLVIPWVIKEEERQSIYPNHTFSNGKIGMKQQEELVRKWIEEKAGMTEESQSLRIQFYPASYRKMLGSILPLVDICSIIRSERADIAILEEPEHLTWFAMPSYARGKAKPDEFIPSNDTGWTAKFKHVVGIIHTNYPAYARAGVVRGSRTLSSNTIHALSKLVCRSYCHKIIKLSKTLPEFARYKECVCNVHGVRSDFLEDQDCQNESSTSGEETKIYFIGKILWAKGFNFLLECEEKYCERFEEYFAIDVYGGGPELEQVKRAFYGVRSTQAQRSPERVQAEAGVHVDSNEKSANENDKGNNDEATCSDHNRVSDSTYSHLSQIMIKSFPFLKDEMKEEQNSSSKSTSKVAQGLKVIKNFNRESLIAKLPRSKYEWRKNPIPARFCGPKDHASLKYSPYKIFVNASISEVLCTTTAEALAMGKFVVLPRHPSNEFFYQFPNCLAYNGIDQFVEFIKFALENEPTPLSPELKYEFTWEAAMDRLINAAKVTECEFIDLEKSGKTQRDKRKAWIHKQSALMLKGDALKSIIGDFCLEDLQLNDYELDVDSEKEDDTYLVHFENNSPKLLALLSFIIAIISYFAQR